MRRLLFLASKESATALLPRGLVRRHSEAVAATTALDHAVEDASVAPSPSPSPTPTPTPSPPVAAAAAAPDLLAHIKHTIAAGFARKHAPQVLHAYAGAQLQKLDSALDIRDSVSVLWACAAVGDDRSDAVYAVYRRLKSTEQYLPADVFVKVLAVAARRGDGPLALDAARLAAAKGYGPLAAPQLVHLLLAMAQSIAPPETFMAAGVVLVSPQPPMYPGAGGPVASGPPLPRPRTRMVDIKDVERYYQEFIAAVAAGTGSGSSGGGASSSGAGGGAPPPAAVYEAVALAFCHTQRNDSVIEVLRHMTQASHEPSLAFCDVLLNNALFLGHTTLLRVLSKWYLHNFDVRLEHGAVARMLHVAAAGGDGALAANAHSLLAKSGFVPAPADYLSWAHACLGGNDVMGAVDVLIAAQRVGVDLLEPYPPTDATSSSSSAPSSSGSSGSSGGGSGGGGGGGGAPRYNVAGLALQESFATRLSRSVRRLDDVYYHLLETLRTAGEDANAGRAVPRLALNALIMAAGRMGQLDRAFATFQEYNGAFLFPPWLPVILFCVVVLMCLCRSLRQRCLASRPTPPRTTRCCTPRPAPSSRPPRPCCPYYR
jgi:uncharacterized membrane protein YgcG